MDNSPVSSSSTGGSGLHPGGVKGTLTDFAAVNFEDARDLAPLAQKIMDDPIALQKLGDQVFKLFAQEIRIQRERGYTHRRQ